MMDARTQAEAIAVLNGIRPRLVVSRADVHGGNVQRWVEVGPEAMLAAWLQKGWRVDMVGEAPKPDPRQLRLLPDEPEAA